jgi:long-subunit acyl-CoA synthetase (AMP-forming)
MLHPVAVAFCRDPAQLFEVATQVRPTLMTGVPRVWKKSRRPCSLRCAPGPVAVREVARWPAPVRRPLLARVGPDACRLATTGSAPTDREVIEFFQALGRPMVEGWDMTELTDAATVSHPARARLGTVGTPARSPTEKLRETVPGCRAGGRNTPPLENVFGLTGLVLVVFVVALFRLHADTGQLWHQSTHPGPSAGEDWGTYRFFAVALFASACRAPLDP